MVQAAGARWNEQMIFYIYICSKMPFQVNFFVSKKKQPKKYQPTQ